jgi:hypothetical protein
LVQFWLNSKRVYLNKVTDFITDISGYPSIDSLNHRDYSTDVLHKTQEKSNMVGDHISEEKDEKKPISQITM